LHLSRIFNIMTIGIYSLTNKINGKRYIGKSINIERRFGQHRLDLKRKVRNKKHTNAHLFNSAATYGIENFSFDILEVFTEIDEGLLRDREIYWMDFYNTCDPDFGYNLRRDSSTGMIVHESTRKLFSEIFMGENNPNYNNRWSQEQRDRMSAMKRAQIADGLYDWMQSPEHRLRLSASSTALWKDEEKKKRMAEKVSQNRSKLRFYQYDKRTGVLVNVWESFGDLQKAYPDFHDKSIYSCCNGWKKSYKGFIWRSEVK